MLSVAVWNSLTLLLALLLLGLSCNWLAEVHEKACTGALFAQCQSSKLMAIFCCEQRIIWEQSPIQFVYDCLVLTKCTLGSSIAALDTNTSVHFIRFGIVSSTGHTLQAFTRREYVLSSVTWHFA